ncbi:aldo/keto reductase [uncultured Aquimarina sp.]|uniref:aldo/keto reductase n=1 Tax=uncultured Aquimarina sp. TaxID=575652 RepID=UPI002608CE24|nr:aldo/keto reductase [uncultured Aquimarina sp.]
MNFRKLGNSNMEISEISFGCMSLQENSSDEIKLIQTAFDKGINYFDTADLYQNGENEMLLGKAVKSFRDQIIIGTKVGNQIKENGQGWDWNPSKRYIIKAVEDSLKRLQVDYIDLYQLHGGTIDDPIDETIDAFETLIKQGKIRHYGISSIRPNVIRSYVQKSNITSVMMQYSILDRRPEESCLELLQKNNIGVLARGTLAKGLLAGKPIKEYLDHSVLEVEQNLKKLKDVSKDNLSLKEAAIQFVLTNTAISSSVIGFRTKKQLLDCLETLKSPSFSDVTYQKLLNTISIHRYKNHR